MKDKTILVIEDNELNMKLVRSLIKMSSHVMIEAGDAETGIKLAREKKPDLILMDIQLPGMDGLSATKILKADQSFKDTVIIALTSHAMEGDDKKVREAGCDGYITKPIDTRNFVQTVTDYLNGSEDSKGEVKN